VKGGKTHIAFVEDPTGYKFELIQREKPTREPFCQVMLRVSNLEKSIEYYEKCLGMTLLRKRENPGVPPSFPWLEAGPVFLICWGQFSNPTNRSMDLLPTASLMWKSYPVSTLWRCGMWLVDDGVCRCLWVVTQDAGLHHSEPQPFASRRRSNGRHHQP
jgi:hypothetical protein